MAAAILLLAPAIAAGPPPDICPLHGVRMRPAELRIVYGLPSQREFAEMRAAKTLFPHGRDCVMGGCVLRPARTVRGFLCPKCVEARERWLKGAGS